MNKVDCEHQRTSGKPVYSPGDALQINMIRSVHTCLECKAERHYDKDSNVTKEWAKP